ncbi:MAG TPA: SDR family oxidoreductase [Candidatus Omnitrophota bacterium]|nr:SDR family oxidoreductase [Candidatus Omnitrophota bacterium]
MDLGLAGKSVLVGGASRGIGFAIARAFAAEGARVVLSARDPVQLEQARAAIGGNAVAIAADLTVAAEVERVVAEAEATAPLTAVIPNVGSGRAPMGAQAGAAEWERMLSLNLVGGVLLAEAALRRMMPRGEGCVTFVGSIAGSERIRAPIPYSAAKAALAMAVKGYAAEAGPSGVRVNAVAPGNVLFPGSVWQRKLDEDAGAVARFLESEVPLRRLATPEEIADAVVFLTSPRSAFTTGSVLAVDGGQTRSV